MTEPADALVLRIAEADTWNERVGEIRKIPAEFGTNLHPAIYAKVAQSVYVPNLAADFAYIPWLDAYELEPFQEAYAAAATDTAAFTKVSPADLTAALVAHPSTLRVFRVLVGYTPSEFSAATGLIATEYNVPKLSSAMVGSIEAGRTPTEPHARSAALTVDALMTGKVFGEPPGAWRRKQLKPDTIEGWDTVRGFAADGVPFGTFLHQRHYGGAFRQLLDATSELRGDVLEDAVEDLFTVHGVPFIRTGSHNQAEIERRFGITVRPAPDFVVFDEGEDVRGMLECKGANDGGTARDKAARFVGLREESIRLGGVPLFAVLGGLGWTRVNDTLGPVVRDTDGRVFTLGNLDDMLTVLPFPQLVDDAPTQ